VLARASLSLLVAKATKLRTPGHELPDLTQEHVELATVVEELYIAATLHSEEEWDEELKADGKTFMAVAQAFVKKLADPQPLAQANIQSALIGNDASPAVWTKYGLDLLGLSVGASVRSLASGAEETRLPQESRKVSLLGGDSLYATAQWATANLNSRACRKLIAKTIASYSDGQLRKRELTWKTHITIRQYLDSEKVAGVGAFFAVGASCAALVNEVDDKIADQLANFGADVGLIISLLKDTRMVGIRSALKRGRITSTMIFALEKDPRLCELLERRVAGEGELEEAAVRIKEQGVADTLRLVNRIGLRACARLDCLEDSKEREALVTLTRGIACLPMAEVLSPKSSHGPNVFDDGTVNVEDCPQTRFSTRFDLKIENLRLRAQMQRLNAAEHRARQRLDAIREISEKEPDRRGDKVPMAGLGLTLDAQEIKWLLLRGLERRAPLPSKLDLDHLLQCVALDQARVQERLLALGEEAESEKLKGAVQEAFTTGGKRLRPALCLLVHQMLQAKVPTKPRYHFSPPVPQEPRPACEKVLLLSTAIEVIHTASLVHDDILDDADTRRQQQAMHRIFGPEVAVLSGDFLFAHASELIESLEDDEVTRLISLVIEEFGYGELAQSALRFDVNVSLFDYMKKSFYKTASLLAAACRASAVLTGTVSEVCDVMYSYGFYLGIAFQIADDILDFTATGQELGKPICQDLAEGNLTAPVILCLQGNDDLGLKPAPGSVELRVLIQRRFAHDRDLERAQELVRDGNGIEMAYTLADKMANKALEALMLVAPADSDACRALAGLTRWAVTRSA